jgi:hypothetical protein
LLLFVIGGPFSCSFSSSSRVVSLVVVAVVVLVSRVEAAAAAPVPSLFVLAPSRNTAWIHLRGILSRVALFSLVMWTVKLFF